MKEWRWDRLREHLGRDRIRSLIGVVRPAIVGLYAACALLWIGGVVVIVPLRLLIPATLALLAALAVAQIVLRRQKLPVWTQKARLLVGLAFTLTALAALSLALLPGQILLPLLPVLQPLPIGAAWLLLLPLDRHLKRRILERAQAVRHQYADLIVIGITGSVGKTTTKELVAHALRDLDPLLTPAHVNTELGVAQWLIRDLPEYMAERERPGVLIVEMGAYRKGEIALMSSYVQQTIGIVTYVGSQHMALFGSQEALFEAKAELVTHLPTNGRAFLNGDNAFCRRMAALAPCPSTIVGTGGPAGLEAFDIAETSTGIRFTADGVAYDVPLHGTHNVTNALLAVAVARHLGIEPRVIRERLRLFIPPAHTFAVREERGVRILDDTHNASEASFRAGVAWAKSQPVERKVLLTSGLIELGEEQERVEKELGALASPIFDRVIFTAKHAEGAFPAAYGKPIEHLSQTTQPVPAGALLVCVGRMSQPMIARLLPMKPIHQTPD